MIRRKIETQKRSLKDFLVVTGSHWDHSSVFCSSRSHSPRSYVLLLWRLQPTPRSWTKFKALLAQLGLAAVKGLKAYVANRDLKARPVGNASSNPKDNNRLRVTSNWLGKDISLASAYWNSISMLGSDARLFASPICFDTRSMFLPRKPRCPSSVACRRYPHARPRWPLRARCPAASPDRQLAQPPARYPLRSRDRSISAGCTGPRTS